MYICSHKAVDCTLISDYIKHHRAFSDSVACVNAVLHISQEPYCYCPPRTDLFYVLRRPLYSGT